MKKIRLLLTAATLIVISCLLAEAKAETTIEYRDVTLASKMKQDTFYWTTNGEIRVYILQKILTPVATWKNPRNYSFSDKEIKELTLRGATKKTDSSDYFPTKLFPLEFSESLENTSYFINSSKEVEVGATTRTIHLLSTEANEFIFHIFLLSALFMMSLGLFNARDYPKINSQAAKIKTIIFGYGLIIISTILAAWLVSVWSDMVAGVLLIFITSIMAGLSIGKHNNKKKRDVFLGSIFTGAIAGISSGLIIISSVRGLKSAHQPLTIAWELIALYAVICVIGLGLRGLFRFLIKRRSGRRLTQN